MFVLFSIIVSIVLGILDLMLGTVAENGTGLLQTVYGLAVLLPSIAVNIRRLHDTNRSGWWLLISFVPCIGWIVMLVFTVQDSQPGTNQYGPNPKGL
jgi:uncharacterized membrane protein YhaH (DUF805 family)